MQAGETCVNYAKDLTACRFLPNFADECLMC